RLVIMARKLYGFMSIMMLIALGTGIWLWIAYGFAGGWLHVKLVFVALMMVYHFWCQKRMLEMKKGHLDHSGLFYRWMNELPLIILSVILVMVVVKPF
ncbi:MAG: putative membrane protein, partial [Cocleimonas sp.]